MKSLLFVSHQASLTGAPILVYEIAKSFHANHWHVCTLLGEDGPLLEKFRQIGDAFVDPLYPDEPKYWREIKRVPKRIRFLRKLNPDLIFCNTIHSTKWLVYARLLRIPTITHVLELSMGFQTLGVIEHKTMKYFSQKLIAASDAVKDYLVDRQGIAAENIRVIHAGVDVARFGNDNDDKELRSRLGLDNHMVIGTVGRITYVKGTDLFVELAAHLKQLVGSTTKLKFLVVGTTVDVEFCDQFKQKLHDYQLEQDFIITENEVDTAKYFSLMDIYISTAREDPFPLVVLEAMASRKPVAGFAVGGILEAVTPDCGILLEGIDVEALANEVSGLIKNPARRHEFGSAARKRVEKYFSLERYTADMRNIVESILE